MASQNIIETINIKGYKIEIYQDAGSKFRWRAMNDSENIGSSEQGFKTLDQCKQNLNRLAEIISDTVTNKIKHKNLVPAKVEVMSSDDSENDSYPKEHKAMDWNIFWLMAIILLLSLFIFVKLFILR